ncbi:DUF2599 domain-containing protein [Myceligenerans indicum]|uniref:DUF2599 domain-containing protein n=1 Tax=Myceligenerans indicum TaxID=2593663 RepID=A0ABS1LMX8_9MICO|nr:DUF2599 domain-containing protein [Myceligenerans indicum]MBL0887620.1 DUF2599 domain-containing protein [Myceligenerans indicum]
MRASHVIAVAAAVIVLAALLASRAEPGDGREPAAEATHTEAAMPAPGGDDPGPSASAAPLEHASVAAAGIDLEIAAARVTVGALRPDGTRQVTTSGAPSFSVRTPGADVVEHGDGSVTVRRDGTAVAALTPVDDGSARRSAGTATFTLGDDALSSATWAQREGEGGLSLAVVPEPWVRGAGEAALDLLTAQLASAEPETDSDTMRDQLACHHLGAPDKATWNLEPWRPDVGMLGTIAARCNPTDS